MVSDIYQDINNSRRTVPIWYQMAKISQNPTSKRQNRVKITYNYTKPRVSFTKKLLEACEHQFVEAGYRGSKLGQNGRLWRRLTDFSQIFSVDKFEFLCYY